MLLGDILADFSDDAKAEEILFGIGDIALIVRLRELADASGETVGEYANCAVQRYAAEAGHEEWLTLFGVLARSADPAGELLKRALRHHVHGEKAA
jgi:hypothetical protein